MSELQAAVNYAYEEAASECEIRSMLCRGMGAFETSPVAQFAADAVADELLAMADFIRGLKCTLPPCSPAVSSSPPDTGDNPIETGTP